MTERDAHVGSFRTSNLRPLAESSKRFPTPRHRPDEYEGLTFCGPFDTYRGPVTFEEF